MYSKILILRFPQAISDRPVVCGLVKKHDLVFNILNATILPRKEGVMVLELSGTRKNFKEGLKYLKDQGVDVQNASQEVTRDEEKCTHCGACTAVCPTGALYIRRMDMYVEFSQKQCSICELCTTACPVRAMEITSTNQIFFE